MFYEWADKEEILKYLSGNEDEDYAYKEQVETVKFLHTFLGDSIIKTYLAGDENFFINELDKVLSEDIKDKIDRELYIEDFLDGLNSRHEQIESNINNRNFSYLSQN